MKDKKDSISEKYIELRQKLSQMQVDKINLESRVKTLNEEVKLLKDSKTSAIPTQVHNPLVQTSDLGNRHSDSLKHMESKLLIQMKHQGVIKHENEMLKLTNNRLSEDINKLKMNLEDKRKECNESNVEIKNLKNEKDELDSELNISKSLHSESKRLQENISIDQENKADELHTLLKEMDQMKINHVKELEQQQEKLKDNQLQLENSLKLFQIDKDNFIKSVQQVKEELKESMQTQIDSEKQRLKQNSDEQEKTQNQLNLNLESLTSLIEDYKSENAKIRNSTRQDIDDRDNEIKKLRSEITLMKREQEDYEARYNNYMEDSDAACQKLTIQISEKDREYHDLQNSIKKQLLAIQNQCDSILSEKNIEISNYINENCSLKVQLSHTENKLVETKNAAGVLWEKFQNIESVQTNLKNQHEITKNELNLIQAQLQQGSIFNQTNNNNMQDVGNWAFSNSNSNSNSNFNSSFNPNQINTNLHQANSNQANTLFTQTQYPNNNIGRK